MNAIPISLLNGITHVHVPQKIHRKSCEKKIVQNVDFWIHVLIYYVVTTASIWNVCLVQ